MINRTKDKIQMNYFLVLCVGHALRRCSCREEWISRVILFLFPFSYFSFFLLIAMENHRARVRQILVGNEDVNEETEGYDVNELSALVRAKIDI